ncbi:hypothetical protein ALC56_07526, partial [Trachymyrmex septentrionalis]
QKLCVDGGDTESDGLTKPVATHLNTSPCPCARLRCDSPTVNETASSFSHLGGPRHQ